MRTNNRPALPATPPLTSINASSAGPSTSTGSSSKSSKNPMSSMLSRLGKGFSSRKKERSGNAETQPSVPTPTLRRMPRVDLRMKESLAADIGQGSDELSGPRLQRAASSPGLGQTGSVRLETLLGWPHGLTNVASLRTNQALEPDAADHDVSPRSSTQDGPPQFDISPDASPPRSAGRTDHEIVEEPETESDQETRSHAGSTRSGGTSPERDPSSISRDTEPVPTGRNNPANLLRDAHNERNQNRYHASTDTGIVGVRTTTRPGRPMMLRQAGPALEPMRSVTPAEPGTVAAPPSVRSETGLRKSKKLKALNAFANLFGSPATRGSQSHVPTRGQTTAEAMAPAMANESEFKARIQSIFTDTDEHANAAELAQRLYSELASPRPAVPLNPNAPELSLTHPMLIAERLAQVSGGDAGRALAAYNALREGSFLTVGSSAVGFGSRAAGPSPRASLAQPQLDALSTAAKLTSSPAGFDALLRALPPTLPENRRPHLKRLLEAVAKVETERGRQTDIGVHDSTADGAIVSGDATLAQEVLHIESRALEHVGDDPHASLNAKEKAAIFSWDNGFRERGKGTELAKVQTRLAKMGKYVQRANHLQNLRNVRFDRSDVVRSTGKVVDAKARILAMRAQQTIGRKKSPLTSLRKFGANNNFLMHPDDDAPVLDDNAKTAIKALRARYADVVADPETFAPQLQDPRSKTLPAPVLREALLDHWEQLVEQQQMRPLGNKLDRAALKTIAQNIATRYGVDTEQTRSQIETHLQHWAGSKLKRTGWKFDRVVSRELTLADLQKWADEVHMPMTRRTPLGREIAAGSLAQVARGRVAAAPETHDEASPVAGGAVPSSPTHLEETEFATALRKALTVVNSSAIRPDDLTPDGLHRFTRTYLLEHPWGNPLVASNGGTAGINTSSVSLAIHEVAKKFAPVSVVPILDLRISRSANAVMSIGSTTHGGEIFIGTQRQKAGSIGAGLTASVGPNALKKVLGQGTASAEITPLAVESVRTRGVMVRALRPPKPDRSGQDTGAARAELVGFNDLIWSIAKGEHGALDHEQAWELIANRFFESPTLSIGWQDQDAQTVHHPVSASAGVRVGRAVTSAIVSMFSKSEVERVGANIGYAADLTTLGSNRRKEETGKHRLVRANYLWRFQQNMTTSATLTNPSIPLSHAAGSVTASIPTGSTQITRTFALDDRGFNATFRAILKSGKLSEPYTLREFEERDAKTFVKFLEQPARSAQFAQVFKAAYGPDEGEEAFDNFKKKTKNWAGPGQHYVTRYRLHTEDIKILDELAAVAHSIHERNPDDPMLSKIERAMKARLEDEASWVPSQIFSLEGQTARDAVGVNLGVQFNAQDAVASDRELSAVVVPLPIANEWTRERRDMRPGNTSVHPGTQEPTAGV